MKINFTAFALAFLCLLGASITLAHMGKYSEPIGFHHSFEATRQGFQIVAGFFALCAYLFLSLSFTKKA